jgi:hypothetical protein
MASPETTDPFSTNAFQSAYLDLLRGQDEAFFSAEGENAGPWELRLEDGGYALYRQWQARAHGNVPEAVLRHRDVALLFGAVWPAVGRDPVFRAGARTAEGYEVLGGLTVVGHLRAFNDELLQAANVAAVIARSPLALAALVEAAGPVVQEMIGQILGRRLVERPG